MGISIRIAVSNQHIIKIMLKLDSERKTTIKASIFSFQICRIVTNIIPITIPSDIFCTGILLRIKKRFHTNIIQAVRFEQVDYVESILYILASVCYRKEVPLSMSIGIEISR